MTHHIPVLLTEVLEGLDIQAHDRLVEGTMGYGNHALELIKKLGPKGIYIGIDQDKEAITHCQTLLKGENISLHHDNYKNIPEILEKEKHTRITKLFLDLGFSSPQLDTSERGLSFQSEGPLDMRLNQESTLTAKDILNTYAEKELSDIFFHYGELRHNKKLCENILQTRRKTPLETTSDLVALIKKSYFFHNKRQLMIKTFSQVFQALRIEVNDEFTILKQTLEDSLSYLEENGRAAIITFHSGEDRIVKQFIKQNKQAIQPINKKVIQPTQKEIRENPRAKSAKLRVFQRLSRA